VGFSYQGVKKEKEGRNVGGRETPFFNTNQPYKEERRAGGRKSWLERSIVERSSTGFAPSSPSPLPPRDLTQEENRGRNHRNYGSFNHQIAQSPNLCSPRVLGEGKGGEKRAIYLMQVHRLFGWKDRRERGESWGRGMKTDHGTPSPTDKGEGQSQSTVPKMVRSFRTMCRATIQELREDMFWS